MHPKFDIYVFMNKNGENRNSIIKPKMVDWLLVGCISSRDKYFMDIQDEKRSRIYNNYAEWEKYQKTGVATFGLPQKKEGKLNNDEKNSLLYMLLFYEFYVRSIYYVWNLALSKHIFPH